MEHQLLESNEIEASHWSFSVYSNFCLSFVFEMDQSDQLDPSLIVFIRNLFMLDQKACSVRILLSVDMDWGEVMIDDIFMLENEMKL